MKLALLGTLLFTLSLSTAFAGGGGFTQTICKNSADKSHVLLVQGSLNWFTLGEKMPLFLDKSFQAESTEYLVVEETDTGVTLKGNKGEEKVLLDFPTNRFAIAEITIVKGEEVEVIHGSCDVN